MLLRSTIAFAKPHSIADQRFCDSARFGNCSDPSLHHCAVAPLACAQLDGMQRSMLSAIRAGRRAKQPNSMVLNAVDRASEPQTACCTDSSMTRQFSAAMQPVVAAAAQMPFVSRAAWDANDLMQSPLVSITCRSYAKGGAKAKRGAYRCTRHTLHGACRQWHGPG